LSNWNAGIPARMSAKRENSQRISVLRRFADKDVRAPTGCPFLVTAITSAPISPACPAASTPVSVYY